MNINLITLTSSLHNKNKALIKEAESFIDEINNELMDEDILLAKDAKDSPIDAVFIASGGSEAAFKKIVKDLTTPFILFSSNKNNSLASCFEIKSYCAQISHPCCFLTGKLEEITLALKHVSNVVMAKEKITNSNLGLIDGSSSWLIASEVSKKEIYDAYKINLVHIKMDELYSLIELKEIDTTHKRYSELVKKYKDKETLSMALNIYSALKKLVKKYDLKGLTIRCFDLLKKYKNTACLALAMLNEEGIVSACEGDVPSLITMYLLYTLTTRPSFMANVSEINLQDLSVILAHCTVPLNMVNKYELLTHFESDLGIGVKGELSEGEVSILKISKKFGVNDNLLIAGKIKESLSLPGFCRTQIRVQLDEGSMYSLLKENVGNHVIVTYSDVLPDFYPLLNLFKNSEL